MVCSQLGGCLGLNGPRRSHSLVLLSGGLDAKVPQLGWLICSTLTSSKVIWDFFTWKEEIKFCCTTPF